MKSPFDKSSAITVREISRDDWEAYRDFYKGMKNPQHFSSFLAGYDLDDPKTYDDIFDWFQKPYVLFGLWDKDRLIGQTSISFIKTDKGNTALFAGSEITDDYRGLHLADMLYQTRMEHLRRIGFNGPVMTTINPTNIASHKAAARNGFVKTGEQDQNGYDILVPAGMK